MNPMIVRCRRCTVRLHGARPLPNPGQRWRSLFAGVAAYAIALQTAFAGFVAGSHIALAAVTHQSAICSSAAAAHIPTQSPDRPSPDQHDGSLCGLACTLTGAAMA